MKVPSPIGGVQPPSILYLTLTLPPEPGATKRPLRQAAILSELGHKITILTTMPNYPEGRIFDDYRGTLYRRETLSGVDVVRVWSFPSANKGRLLRTFSLLTFLIGAVLTGLLLARRDIIVGSVSNPLVETAALTLSRLRHSVLVFEIRDLVPHNLYDAKVFRNRMFIQAMDRYFSWVWRRATLIAAVNNKMIDQLLERGVDRRRLMLLPHGIDYDRLHPIDRERERARLRLTNEFVVLYAGSFSPRYRVPDLINVAPLLAERPSVRLVIVGTGPDAPVVAAKVSDVPSQAVRWLGSVCPEDAERILSIADVFIDSLDASGFSQTTKFVEYLGYARPIIHCRPRARQDRELMSLGIGDVVEIGDATDLARAIFHYLDNPDEYADACRAADAMGRRYFDRRTIVGRFHQALLKCRQ